MYMSRQASGEGRGADAQDDGAGRQVPGLPDEEAGD